jgi:hypothetical protein
MSPRIAVCCAEMGKHVEYGSFFIRGAEVSHCPFCGRKLGVVY